MKIYWCRYRKDYLFYENNKYLVSVMLLVSSIFITAYKYPDLEFICEVKDE
jgi:hypothetical protein